MDERQSPVDSTQDLLVVGSVNEDHFTFVTAFPRPGETVAAVAARRGLGGKGANQAVAAARAGARVRFLAKVGSDGAGSDAIDALQRAGVIADAVEQDVHGATGTASIAVDATGENWVIVDPGANARITVESIDREFDRRGSASVVLAQAEIPGDAIERAAARAHEAGARFVLNLAPVIAIAEETLRACDPLVVNEHEAASIVAARGGIATTPAELASALGEIARSVVITLGSAGAVAAARGRVWDVPGFRVDSVVDTTGAGDAFVGSLCARLAAGDDLEAAMVWASAAASLSVERPGAAESYAAAREVEQRLLAAGVSA
ncbi:PfkB family carbohydrate kinase [Leifsonia sp. NPDC080035]|uniref:Ribokinase n=1 Tax=Leifsonia sp. NPDC080035 TaxID=3143936 RepID=A0AAU7GH13_9MICO